MQKFQVRGGISDLEANFSRVPLLEAVGRVQQTFRECCVAEGRIGSDTNTSTGGIGLTTEVNDH